MNKKQLLLSQGYKIVPRTELDLVKDGDDWILDMILNNEVIATLRVYMNKGASFIAASDISVNEDHRRKGIATFLYDYAEEITGKPMRSAEDISDDPDHFTKDAKKFWSSR